ncbi:histidine kinase OS=Streptomyces rimosus subsp. rimosus (strain ATCC / DSM 40260 / JCM 4667 / NRRL 2234) OX=1265868 GN=SRIM_039990 PE=4 SV=1 [Streptomyces rimosus subsp. rimosus]
MLPVHRRGPGPRRDRAGVLLPLLRRAPGLLRPVREHHRRGHQHHRRQRPYRTLLGESQRLARQLQARTGELQRRQAELQRSNEELEEKAALLASQNRDIETKNLEIEQARQELEDRAQQLALASQYKSEFLANMIHELRTPLNRLLILAQLLARQPGPETSRARGAVREHIHRAGSDLLQLINDILDLSKIEAGKMDVRPKRLPLIKLLNYVHDTFRPMTLDRGLAFEVSVSESVPKELFSDEQRLQQVLRNLLSNAVKFTAAGKIDLRVDRAGDGSIAFTVTDTGIGIAPEKLPVIFEAFQQADGTTNRKYGGTGLGLSISREIAGLWRPDHREQPPRRRQHLHPVSARGPRRLPGADLWAGGRRGTGGRVGGRGARPAAHSPAAAPAPPRRLLVIEERARGLLSTWPRARSPSWPGAARTWATVRSPSRSSPRSAPRRPPEHWPLSPSTAWSSTWTCRAAKPCASWRRWTATPPYAPSPSSPTTAGVWRRSRNAPCKHVPVPSRWKSSPAWTSCANASPCICPPSSPVTCCRWYTPEEPEAPQPVDDSLSGRTVLVVDDDARNLYALSGILEMHGIHVRHAENGREGIQALTEHPDIDLILMDVMMPEMDGYTATAEIRRMPEHAGLPIIAVTAKAMPGDREKSLASGASDYVTKPVDTDDLITCVRRWLAS